MRITGQKSRGAAQGPKTAKQILAHSCKQGVQLSQLGADQ